MEIWFMIIHYISTDVLLVMKFNRWREEQEGEVSMSRVLYIALLMYLIHNVMKNGKIMNFYNNM